MGEVEASLAELRDSLSGDLLWVSRLAPSAQG
jgi:hypothetical protein